MDEVRNPSQTAWTCKYHAVFTLDWRRGTRYAQLRRHLGKGFPSQRSRESTIAEGQPMPDQVHMMIAIPPKDAVSQVTGLIKGKSASRLAQIYGECNRNLVGWYPWARGTPSRRSAATRRSSARTFASRRKRTNGWSSEGFGGKAPPQVDAINVGSRQRPRLPLRSALEVKSPASPGVTYPNSYKQLPRSVSQGPKRFTRLRYSVGVIPTCSRKKREKWPGAEKPRVCEMSATG